MSRFLLEWKLDKKPNRARPASAVDAMRVVLGSRPLADLFVNDRMVAQEALAFTFDGKRLEVEVLTPLAGVFVDGRPLAAGTRGPVHHGSTVQTGQVLVEVSIDEAKGECGLVVGEGYLGKTVAEAAKKLGKEFALADSGPQEHRWGKSAVLSRWNWIAALLGLAGCAAFFGLTQSDVLSRGELRDVHAIGAPRADGKTHPDSCASCHDPFSSDYTPKCAKCHEGYASADRHPYAKTDEFSCAACHTDHAGAKADIVPSMETGADGWPKTCALCHAGEDREAKVTAAVSNPALPASIRDVASPPRARTLQVDGFSHADHRIAKERRVGASVSSKPPEGSVPLACGECHVKDPAEPQGDFAAVAYETCLKCHAEWRVDVHGRDEDGVHCLQCHAKAASPGKITRTIRTVEVPASGSLYRLPPRKHDLAKDDCRSCHVSGAQHAPSGEPRVLAFRHDHHVRSVTPPKGGEADLSASCVPCHKGVAESRSLAGLGGALPRADVSTATCGTCHTDGDPVPVAAADGRTRTVTDMFHLVHTVEPGVQTGRAAMRAVASRGALAQGCLSCHVPAAGAAPMTLRAGVSDCSACHAGHESLGEGKCVLCHVDRASPANTRDGKLVYRTLETGIFDAASPKAARKTVAPIESFRHFSDGHAEPSGASGERTCVPCHDAASIDRATRVLDVPLPGAAERGCLECHVRERFHR
ncbi:MAG: hypothetical protein HMLKMBBP_03991 [Planctomycetes bacterium]|nr:hypothetical protein [Planctomycetota bacterium]